MDIKIHKSNFSRLNEDATAHTVLDDMQVVTSLILLVHLTSGKDVTVTLNKNNKYKIKKNMLYKGLFKKIGVIKSVELIRGL